MNARRGVLRLALASVLGRAVVGGTLLGGAALGLAGCSRESRPQFRNTDITGADFASDLRLTGHDGKEHTLSEFRGKLVVVFFGFTQCPDVCPTTMAEMADVMKQLGPGAEQVQVLFVTVDPERDTPELLAKYVPSFDPRFLGLTGTPEQTAVVARSFKVFYQKVPGKTPGSYTIDHTAGSYVFGRDGKLRLFVRHGQGVDTLAGDLKQLLNEKGA